MALGELPVCGRPAALTTAAYDSTAAGCVSWISTCASAFCVSAAIALRGIASTLPASDAICGLTPNAAPLTASAMPASSAAAKLFRIKVVAPKGRRKVVATGRFMLIPRVMQN